MLLKTHLTIKHSHTQHHIVPNQQSNSHSLSNITLTCNAKRHRIAHLIPRLLWWRRRRWGRQCRTTFELPQALHHSKQSKNPNFPPLKPPKEAQSEHSQKINRRKCPSTVFNTENIDMCRIKRRDQRSVTVKQYGNPRLCRERKSIWLMMVWYFEAELTGHWHWHCHSGTSRVYCVIDCRIQAVGLDNFVIVETMIEMEPLIVNKALGVWLG